MSASRSTRRLRLTIVLLAAVLALVAVSERPHATTLTGEMIELVAFACIVAATLGRLWTSLFIAGFKDDLLVRSGPYSALRHPLYALSWIAMLGIGLVTRSIAITLALAAIFAVVYWTAARGEDAALLVAHGETFERYRATTPAVLPRASDYAVPETLEVRPRVLWKAFLDAGSMLGLYALLQLADALQRVGVTPTWFTLP
jgi:protein-S-isoprenylcysteine O-methyltransferase Ste14